jgi:YbgC/YbaW family acyl-CoA thioester hydrolase
MGILFRTTRRVEFVDTDVAGIVHFSNFFRYMESAEAEFLRSLGLSFKMIWQGHSLGLPRVAASCDYLSPARFDDVLDVAVWVEKLGRSSITYAFDFSLEGKAVAKGRVTAACCRVNADRSFAAIEIPAEIRAKLESPPGS